MVKYLSNTITWSPLGPPVNSSLDPMRAAKLKYVVRKQIKCPFCFLKPS
jgi:hypothetical protein